MKVRILAFLLTLCMVVTMIPTFAFAETVTLADKVENTADNGTVTLDSDYTGDIIVGDKSLTIDLNGYSYSGWLTVTGDNTITIVDGNGKDPKGAFLGTVAGSQAKLVIKSAGKIAAEHLPYVATTSIATANGTGFYKVTVAEEGTKYFTVGNVSYVDFTAAADAAVITKNPVVIPDGKVVAGTVSGDITISAEGAYEVNGLVVNNATVSFNGGIVTFKGNGVSGTGKVIFKNVVLPENVCGNTTGLDVMYGVGYYPNSGTITSFAPGSLKWVTNYVVDEATVALVKVGNKFTQYADITSAVSAASTTNDSTLILLAAQSNAFFVSSGKVVLDLNGFAVATVINSANLTVKGGNITNLVNTGTLTVLGGNVVVDNNGKVDVKGGDVTVKGTLKGVTIYFAENTYVRNETAETFVRANFEEYVGLDSSNKVIAYAAIVNGTTGFLTVQDAFNATKDGDIVKIYAKGVKVLTVEKKITIEGETIGDVTITATGSITTKWGEKDVTYGPDTYAEIGTPICYVTTAEGEDDDHYFMDLQAAVDYIEGLTSKKGTVVLLADHTGAGVKVGLDEDTNASITGVDITIDLGTHTYTFNEGVGSTGTESNGFQLLKGNTVTIQNGKLNVADSAADKFYTIIQNYANLTIKDVDLDGTNLDKWSGTDGDSYVVSNNSGNVLITGNTSITANDDGDKAFAFDSYKSPYYDAPTVTIDTTGIITGKFEASDEATLSVKAGNFTHMTYEDIYPYFADDKVAAEKTEGGFKVSTSTAATQFVASIGDVKYTDLAVALEYAIAHKDTYVILIKTAETVDIVLNGIADAEATEYDVAINFNSANIGNITNNADVMLSVYGPATVTGDLTANAGKIRVLYEWTTYNNTEFYAAEGAEIILMGGKWVGVEDSELFKYMSYKYDVVENINAETLEVESLSVVATDVAAVVVDAEGNELSRYETFFDAWTQVLTVEELENGIVVIVKAETATGAYDVKLDVDQEFAYENKTGADLPFNAINDDESVTTHNAEKCTFTGTETLATADGLYFDNVQTAVNYAIKNNVEVTVLEAGVAKTFSVTKDETVTVDGTLLGYGVYTAETIADCEATTVINKVTVYYDTLVHALAVATANESYKATVNVINEAVYEALNVELGDFDIILNGNDLLTVTALNVSGATKTLTVNKAAITTVIVDTAKVALGTCGTINNVIAENGATVTVNAGTTVTKLDLDASNAVIKGTSKGDVEIGELVLSGKVTLTISATSYTTIKNITVSEGTTFGKTGITGGKFLDPETNVLLDGALAKNYEFSKVVDGDVVYYKAINAANCFAVVDGELFDDLAAAIAKAVTTDGALLEIYAQPTHAEDHSVAIKNYILYCGATGEDGKYASVKAAIAEGVDFTFIPEDAVKFYIYEKNGTYTAKELIASITVTEGEKTKTYIYDSIAEAVAAYNDFNNDSLVINVVYPGVITTTQTTAVLVNGKTYVLGAGEWDLTALKPLALINGRYYFDAAVISDYASFGLPVTIVDNVTLTLNIDDAVKANITVENGTVTLAGAGAVAINYVAGAVVVTSYDLVFDAKYDVTASFDVPVCFVENAAGTYNFVRAEATYNGTPYVSFVEALAAANADTTTIASNKVIKLYDTNVTDTNTTIVYVNTKGLTLDDVTLNLGGLTLAAAYVTVKGEVYIANGSVVATGTATTTAYVITASANAKLTLNDVKVGAGVGYDSYTGKQVAVVLAEGATLAGKNIDLVNEDKNNAYVNGGILVTADPTKNSAKLNVAQVIDFTNAIFYKFTTGKIECLNHIMTDGHTHMCQFCGENAVKVIVTDAEIVEIIGQHGKTTIDRCVTDGNYYVFSGTTITIKHGAVPAGKHFAGWNIAGNVTDTNGNPVLTNSKANSYIVYSEVTNAGVSIAPSYVDNDEVEVKIYGTNFIVEGAMDTAQYGNYIGSFRVGDVITITYNPAEIAGFGKLVYWVNDNNTVIGTDNTIEYTVPANGGTVTAIVDYAAANSVYVVFQNGATATGAKVLSSQYYAVKDGAVKVNAPALPALGNKNVLGWKIEGTDTVVEDLNAAIYAAYADGKTQVTLVPAIGETDKVEITVDGDAMMVDPSVFTTIEAPEAPEGKVFSHWEINGNVVPVAKLTWKFNKGDVVVSKFANEDDVTLVDAFASLTNDNAVAGDKVIFSAVFKLLGEGYEMLDAGIVYSTSVSDKNLLVPSSTDPNVKVKHIENLADFATVTYTLTLNFKGGQKKDVWAVAYVNYKDADGVSKVVYSPLSVYDVIPQD